MEEQRGRGLKLLYGRQGKSHKPEELLWGVKRKLPRELTTELELPAYFNLLWCKKIYALVYTQDSFLLKTRKESLNQFFLLDLFLFTLLIFCQSANDN